MKHRDFVFILGQIHSKANKFITEELHRHGITGLAPSHGAIIAALLERHRLTMSELAQQIDRDKSTVTALIKKLEHEAYVVRTPSSNDNRVSYISLTSRGKKIRPAFLKISGKLLNECYKSLRPDEIDTVNSILIKINMNW